MWANLWFTLIWLVLIIPTLFWWTDSILWVAVMSIWANVASHFAGFIAGRTEVDAKRGYNLTEADKAWIMNLIKEVSDDQRE